MINKVNKNYNASSIEVIENLEAVRKRPGMYIGDTGVNGLHHLVAEILDNSIDEYLSGYATKIILHLYKDNTVSIEDNGRGIPVDIHKKTKKPAVETIFTTLHSGGKFGGSESGYKVSGGLHGVGAAVTNALSDFVEIIIWKNKKEHYLKFENGGKKVSKLKIGKVTTKRGTRVTFKPSKLIFNNIDLKANNIIKRLKELSYLNPDLTIIFFDHKNKKDYKYKSKNGLVDMIDEISKNQKEISSTYTFNSKNSKIDFNVAFKYTSSIQENFISFVNNIPTVDGGTHVAAFKTSLTKAINDYATKNRLRENNKNLDGEDVRDGMNTVISIYLVESLLQFEGQTKSKLSSPNSKKFLEEESYRQIIHYLNTNKEEAKKIIEKAYITKRSRENAKRAREVNKELRKGKQKTFAGKLVIAQTPIKENRELFVVEGDSAGGSAKLGRDRKTQAILPLKGKIINTEKSTLKAIIANEELSTLISAIGTGIDKTFNVKKSNYGKIIIMTDADTDGAHIQVLLLTFFFRFMKPLIENDMVYIALPPLYKVTKKNNKEIKYLWSDEELNNFKSKEKNIEIQRYKGLGEMNSDQLWETTMDPKKRTLIKVNIEDESKVNKIVEILMGIDPKPRRTWIEENVVFSLEDDYKILK